MYYYDNQGVSVLLTIGSDKMLVIEQGSDFS